MNFKDRVVKDVAEESKKNLWTHFSIVFGTCNDYEPRIGLISGSVSEIKEYYGVLGKDYDLSSDNILENFLNSQLFEHYVDLINSHLFKYYEEEDFKYEIINCNLEGHDCCTGSEYLPCQKSFIAIVSIRKTVIFNVCRLLHGL